MRILNAVMIAAVAVGLMATSAMAVTAEDDVTINIEVAEEVQLWASDSVVNLLLDGKNAENSDVSASSLNVMTNVAADISVAVDGTLPEPIVGGGGIQFFIFPESDDEAGAYDAIAANAYNPAGALVWDKEALGTEEDFASVGINTSIALVDKVYAAAAPGELPMPDEFELTATYTITPENN